MTNFESAINKLKADSDTLYKVKALIYRGCDVDAREYLKSMTGATDETARSINDLENAGELDYYLK